jgi:hypothetical protein
VEAAKLVVDTRNATKDLGEFKERIIKLGAGNNEATGEEHEPERSRTNVVTH